VEIDRIAIARKRRRLFARAGVAALGPVAAVGFVLAGNAFGAGGTQPSMEVKPSTTGLEYTQTVEIKGHHLPKGSGTVAATICGIDDASGKPLKSAGADDCAGANEVGKLVIVKSWQSNGEFDTQYTLPKSGQKFGKNQRYCDKNHHCALVVADANPDNPAYHVDTIIQFVDQQPFGAKPKPKATTTTTSTTTTTFLPGVAREPNPKTTAHATARVDGNSDSPGVHVDAQLGAHPDTGDPSLPNPSGPSPIPAPVADALSQVCGQLAPAVSQAGGDATAFSAACTSAANGDASQLKALLQSPSLLCIAGASAWQNNAQVTDACNEAAGALAPVTSALSGALGPLYASQ
jgi:hypothetical protein